MKILTWETKNFGDRLNDLIWPPYLANKIDEDDGQLLVGIGSLLNHRLPRQPQKYILGSGVGHGDVPTVDSTWHVLWVRGPLSANVLRIPDCGFITDGAVLLADLFRPASRKLYKTSFMPHCSAVDSGAVATLKHLCDELGINLIDPYWPTTQVLEHIAASQRLITEALHGAIAADALRVPWIPVARRGVLSFKWLDWTRSMDMPYAPTVLPYRPQWFSQVRHEKISRRVFVPVVRPISKALLRKQLKSISSSDDWFLSKDGVVKEKIQEIKARLKKI